MTRLGFDPHQLAVATVVFEGSEGGGRLPGEDVFYRIAKDPQRDEGGGRRTASAAISSPFGIAYIRDLTFDALGHRRELRGRACPWSRALELYERVRPRVLREHEQRRLPGKPFFTGRITQVYPHGGVHLFLSRVLCKGVYDPVRHYGEMEHRPARRSAPAEALLSHHHGIGKIRQDFVKEIYSAGARSPSCGR